MLGRSSALSTWWRAACERGALSHRSPRDTDLSHDLVVEEVLVRSAFGHNEVEQYAQRVDVPFLAAYGCVVARGPVNDTT